MADYLAPYQYGVSTPGESEVVAHLVQLYLEQDKNCVILKVDAKNAFNRISRNLIMDEVSKHLPGLYPFVANAISIPLL